MLNLQMPYLILGNFCNAEKDFRQGIQTLKMFLMCKRKKGISEGKILQFLSFFGLWGQVIYFVFQRGTGEESGTRGYLGKFPPPFLI